MNAYETPAYPLAWPPGQPRSSILVGSRFKPRGLATLRKEILAELERLHAYTVIVSTNIPVRLDGGFKGNSRAPDDPGVAVYFSRLIGRRGVPYVVACDTYARVWENMRAIVKTLEALRTIERHGSRTLLEQAFSGFRALPAGTATAEGAAWWATLKVDPDAPLAVAERAYRLLARLHHPDTPGGSEAAMRELNRAIAIAREKG